MPRSRRKISRKRKKKLKRLKRKSFEGESLLKSQALRRLVRVALKRLRRMITICRRLYHLSLCVQEDCLAHLPHLRVYLVHLRGRRCERIWYNPLGQRISIWISKSAWTRLVITNDLLFESENCRVQRKKTLRFP
jgi:hypothetical protein